MAHAEPDITIGMLLEHMRAFEGRMMKQLQTWNYELRNDVKKVEHRLDRVEFRLGHVEHRLGSVEKRLNVVETKIDNMDLVLNDLEIAMVEQKHEQRIQALEQHTGLVKA